MKANCCCKLCCLTMRMEIEQIFMRSPEWLGIYQVHNRIYSEFCSWEFFMQVWFQMITDGLLIESFAPDSDEFPRYLLSRLAVRPDRVHR
jgi:hypothetical protein